MKDNALYLEVDEDITSAIDKLSKSAAGSVQIVVPKRSTMLQSIINLKLLKKAAEQSGKELVLVTGDRIATELAARVGLAVAPAIGAKPVIAEATIPEALKSNEEIIEATDPEPPAPAPETKPKPFKKPLLKRFSVSDGPPLAAAGLATASAEGDAVAEAGAAAAHKPPKVPNFGRLRRRVLWLALAALLVVAYLGAMSVFTTAKVTLYATGTRVNIDTAFSVDPSLKTTDQAKSVLAGQAVTVTKDLSGPFVPTGKKDAGTKATGAMTIKNCLDANNHLYVAGTRFQAPDGKIFKSTADVTVPGGQGSFLGCSTPGTATVDVQAEQNGDSYNEAPAKYTLPGLSASQQTGQNSITAQGAQMTGGTTKTVTITAQSDVDTAKAALLAKDKDASARDIQGRVPSGYVALSASQAISADAVSPSPTVGAEGDTGTLSIKVTYSVLAVKQSEYQSWLHLQEQKQVGDANQIYDDGLPAAQVSTTGDKDSSGRQAFHLTTEAYGGAKLDKTAIAAKLKGQRFGDAATAAKGLPGVTRADISISPGWVSKMPTRADKISITIQVAASK